MPLFAYVGQNAETGKKKKATIEADSLKDAKLRLRKQNIYVLSITVTQVASASQKSSFLAVLRRKPPKPEDLAIATKQFAILQRAAVDISDSLKSVSEQVENEELKSVYIKVRELVSEGKSLSDAHREFPKTFSPLYCNMLSAAERAGALPTVLRRLSEFIQYQIEIRRKVTGALTYPCVMVVVTIAITMFLFVNVLPKMTKAFKSMKVILPWYSILINDISAFLQTYWLVSLLGLGAIMGVLYAWSKTTKGRRIIDSWMLNMPIFGPLVQRVVVSRFTKTLATVLSAGVRIVEGLKLTRNIVNNKIMEEAIDTAIEGVEDGEKLSAALEKTGKFPTMMIHMMRTGEKTGKLEEMLTNIAEAYDEEVESKISTTTKLIEPIMMVVMAGVVVVIVAAVMGPMLEAMNQVK